MFARVLASAPQPLSPRGAGARGAGWSLSTSRASLKGLLLEPPLSHGNLTPFRVPVALPHMLGAASLPHPDSSPREASARGRPLPPRASAVGQGGRRGWCRPAGEVGGGDGGAALSPCVARPPALAGPQTCDLPLKGADPAGHCGPDWSWWTRAGGVGAAALGGSGEPRVCHPFSPPAFGIGC